MDPTATYASSDALTPPVNPVDELPVGPARHSAEPHFTLAACVLICLSLPLLRLPVPQHLKLYFYLAALGPYAAFVALSIITRRFPVTTDFKTLITAGYMFVITVQGIVAAATFGNVSPSRLIGPPIVALVMASFAYAVSFSTRDVKTKRAFFYSFYLSVFLFVLSNVVLHWMGVERAESRNSIMGNGVISMLIGFPMRRISPPLCVGPGTFGTTVTILLIWSVAYLFDSQASRIAKVIPLVSIVLGIYSWLLADSRVAILSFVLLAILLAIRPLLVFVGRFGSVLLFAMVPFVLIVLFPLFSDLQRKGEVHTGFGRNVIWRGAVSELMDFDMKTVFGYGVCGQEAAKLSRFGNRTLARTMEGKEPTAHNFFLQVAIEFGVIGLAFTILLIKTLSIRLSSRIADLRNHPLSSTFVMLLLGLLALMFNGCTESNPSYGGMELFLIFVFITQFGLFL